MQVIFTVVASCKVVVTVGSAVSAKNTTPIINYKDLENILMIMNGGYIFLTFVKIHQCQLNMQRYFILNGYNVFF